MDGRRKNMFEPRASMTLDAAGSGSPPDTTAPSGEESSRWHGEVITAVRAHVKRAHEILDSRRHGQEPDLVAMLLGRLEGVVYDGPHGHVELKSTIVASRGPGTAEAQWGADFALTAEIDTRDASTSKAVLGQAKRQTSLFRRRREQERLLEQCGKMLQATTAAVVLLLTKASPLIGEVAKAELGVATGNFYPLDHYLVNLLECHHGDSRPDFVRAVSDSQLRRLHIVASRP